MTLIGVADAQPADVNIHLLNHQPGGLFDVVAHTLNHTVCHGGDTQPVFNDQIQVNLHLPAVIVDGNAQRRIFYQRLGQAVSQVLGCQANNAVRF